VRCKCWENYSQLHFQNIALGYLICLECRTVLKWISETAFTNLTEQLRQAGATLDEFIITEELFRHPQHSKCRPITSIRSICTYLRCIKFHHFIVYSMSRNVERVYLDIENKLIYVCEPIKHGCINCRFWSEKAISNSILQL
jgi:hypothetical protein